MPLVPNESGTAVRSIVGRPAALPIAGELRQAFLLGRHAVLQRDAHDVAGAEPAAEDVDRPLGDGHAGGGAGDLGLVGEVDGGARRDDRLGGRGLDRLPVDLVPLHRVRPQREERRVLDDRVETLLGRL
jgi:hypothetical protein